MNMADDHSKPILIKINDMTTHDTIIRWLSENIAPTDNIWKRSSDETKLSLYSIDKKSWKFSFNSLLDDYIIVEYLTLEQKFLMALDLDVEYLNENSIVE